MPPAGTPPYVALAASGELERRAAAAHELLGPRCVVCPRGCKVDRREDVAGLCAIGRHAVVASYFPHFGEEDCLRGRRGSGTIFFSGCNLRCVFCLPAGTLVATDRGPRPIESIFESGLDELAIGAGRARRVADVRVYTVTGEPAPVAKAFRHEYHGELVRVKPLCAPAVRLTPNHEVFAAHRSDPDRLVKVRADELTPEHHLLVPKRAVRGETQSLDVPAILAAHPAAAAPPQRRIASERLVAALRSPATSAELGLELGYHPAYVRTLRSRLARGMPDVVGQPPPAVLEEDGRVRFPREPGLGLPARVPLDERLAWLLGIYCAEGHVSTRRAPPNSHRLVFSFGHGEQALQRRTAELLIDVFRAQPQIVSRRTTVTVETGKASLAVLFKRLAGHGASEKRVPAELFGADEAIVRAFLDGYLSGDGTETPTHLVAQTVSPSLAHGLYELGLRLSVLPSIHRRRGSESREIEGRRVRQSALWYVKFERDRFGRPSPRERVRWKDAGTHFLVPIHRIDTQAYQGEVFNLEVDHPSHSFIAPAVAVGNCQNHDISWEVRGERAPPGRLAEMMLELQALGCHNVNLVTPEHVVPQVLEALPLAAERGLRLPIVYNTSAYDALDGLRLLDGVADVYMPDFKLWAAESGRRYLKRADYADVARETIREMHRQVGDLVLDERGMARRGVILRHLVMPGLVEETELILRWIAEELGTGCYVNLMAQYYVSGKVGRDGEYDEIARGIHREEYERALAVATGLGLRLDPRSVGERRLLAPAG